MQPRSTPSVLDISDGGTVVASVEELSDGTIDESAAFRRRASCFMMSMETVCSASGMAVLRRRTASLVSA